MKCRFHDNDPCNICAGLDEYAPYVYKIENENRRMLMALEMIKDITTDMLDPARRAGPGGRPEENETDIQDLRGKGMQELWPSRPRDSSIPKEEI